MKVPPYSKPLRHLIECDVVPDNSVYLYIGELSWEKAKSSVISRPTRTLVLPPSHHPNSYIWPVKGCDILIVETSHMGQEYINNVAAILFAFMAKRITLIASDFSVNSFKKDF